MAARRMLCKTPMPDPCKALACIRPSKAHADPGALPKAQPNPRAYTPQGSALLRAMLSRIAALFGPRHAALALDFLRFGTVGAIGFMVDTAMVYATRAAIGLYWAGLLAYLAAASGNWLINRLWTFQGRGAGTMHRQWALFLAANAIGFALNRGVYVGLISVSPLAFEHPILAIMGGTVAGMFLNFHLSRTVVFR